MVQVILLYLNILPSKHTKFVILWHTGAICCSYIYYGHKRNIWINHKDTDIAPMHHNTTSFLLFKEKQFQRSSKSSDNDRPIALLKRNIYTVKRIKYTVVSCFLATVGASKNGRYGEVLVNCKMSFPTTQGETRRSPQVIEWLFVVCRSTFSSN